MESSMALLSISFQLQGRWLTVAPLVKMILQYREKEEVTQQIRIKQLTKISTLCRNSLLSAYCIKIGIQGI